MLQSVLALLANTTMDRAVRHAQMD